MTKIRFRQAGESDEVSAPLGGLPPECRMEAAAESVAGSGADRGGIFTVVLHDPGPGGGGESGRGSL
jgi:hypothetical protein